MDGVFSGLTSIVPIMPDQSTISDRSGMNRPPVEIMPLPSNSFMSDDTTTELLNNPFTLSLNKDGRGRGDTGGGKAVGGTVPQSGQPPTDALMPGDKLEDAYTLSLGQEENTPVTAETAKEMSRMKNYEMLGKTAGRRNRNVHNAPVAAQPPDDGNEMLSEKVNSLLSRYAARQNPEGVQLATHNEVADTVSRTQEVFLSPPETGPEEDAGPRQAAQPGGTAAAVNRQDLAYLSNLSGTPLSASDIAFILTLEPELREALMNMLSNVNITGNAVPENSAAIINNPMPIQAQPGSIQQSMNAIPNMPDAAAMKRIADMPDKALAALLSNEGMTRLAAEVLVSGKLRGASQPITQSGSMDHLGKVNELPYSLYIFGHMSAERKDDTDEDIAIRPSRESSAEKKQTGKFLRLSEAIKMASVLHNLYYGGSGRFPEETPWYMPHVRYAINNGIIKDGEFGDYNDFATRAEAAYIFSNCVPKAEFPSLNYVSDIPDVVETTDYGASVYLLSRAGVLKANSRNAGFYPERLISKTEAAAIIGRIATPKDRKPS